MDVIFGAREDVIYMVTAEWKKSVSDKRRNKRFWMVFFVEKRLYIEHKLKKKKKNPVKSAGRDI